MELFDELFSGVPVIAAPAIQRELGASYQVTAAALLLVPALLALVVEPVLFLLADRHPRAWFVRGGAIGMAVSAVLGAAAPTAGWLACAEAPGVRRGAGRGVERLRGGHGAGDAGRRPPG